MMRQGSLGKARRTARPFPAAAICVGALRLSSLAAIGCGALVLAGCGAAQRPDGGTGLLQPGDRVPNLNGTDHDGYPLRLQDYQGKRQVVVFFYPKDGTPGCTKEACAFRDSWSRFAKAGIEVIGVSSDSLASHREFAKEHRLPMRLISDEDGTWARAFGVSSFAGMYSRVSTLIGKDGTVTKTYPDVDPGQHALQILQDASAPP